MPHIMIPLKDLGNPEISYNHFGSIPLPMAVFLCLSFASDNIDFRLKHPNVRTGNRASCCPCPWWWPGNCSSLLKSSHPRVVPFANCANGSTDLFRDTVSPLRDESGRDRPTPRQGAYEVEDNDSYNRLVRLVVSWLIACLVHCRR